MVLFIRYCALDDTSIPGYCFPGLDILVAILRYVLDELTCGQAS